MPAKLETVKFYSRDPDEPVQMTGVFDPATGETEDVKFTNGVLETSNPLWVAALTERAKDPSHPISASPPKKKG